MAITFDGPGKLVLLDGAATVSVQVIYSRWVDWFATATNSRFLPAFRTVGDPGAQDGYAIPVIAFLLNGWRIRPLAGDYTLTVGGGIIVAPTGVDPFDQAFSAGPRIRYEQPVAAIAYSTAGGAGAPEIAAAVLAAAQAAPIHSDVQRINGVEIAGSGATGDSFRPA